MSLNALVLLKKLPLKHEDKKPANSPQEVLTVAGSKEGQKYATLSSYSKDAAFVTQSHGLWVIMEQPESRKSSYSSPCLFFHNTANF